MAKIKRKVAIAETIFMWEELAETGEYDKTRTKSYKKYQEQCFLCLYTDQYLEGNCTRCLLVQNGLPDCFALSSTYYKWNRALTVGDRKKYAKQFVKQLKQLK